MVSLSLKWIQKNMKEKSTSKYLWLWNLRPKPNFVITFRALLLMICFKEIILILYISLPNITIKGTMKKEIQSKKHFVIIFTSLTKAIMVLVYWSTFNVYLTVLAPTHKSLLHVRLQKSKCAKKFSRSRRVWECHQCTTLNIYQYLQIKLSN